MALETFSGPALNTEAKEAHWTRLRDRRMQYQQKRRAVQEELDLIDAVLAKVDEDERVANAPKVAR